MQTLDGHINLMKNFVPKCRVNSQALVFGLAVWSTYTPYLNLRVTPTPRYTSTPDFTPEIQPSVFVLNVFTVVLGHK